MMAGSLPQSLKPINSFLRLAKEYDKKDAVVSYFCRMYAVQKGISIDSKSAESKGFLFGLMDQLEIDKKSLIENDEEALSSDVVAQAHIETQSIDIFNSADSDDRNGVFDKKVTKAFYTASLLFEVLTQFGEANDECKIMQMYSKYKATYLHRCSQTGETPVPGPAGSGFEDALAALVDDISNLSSLPQSSSTDADAEPGHPDLPSVDSEHESRSHGDPSRSDISLENISKPPETYSSQPEQYNAVAPSPAQEKFMPATIPPVEQDFVAPTPRLKMGEFDVVQVQKHLKGAVSALEYEDISTAVEDLANALQLLTGN